MSVPSEGRGTRHGDAAGNRTTVGGDTATFDARNRLLNDGTTSRLASTTDPLERKK